MVNSLHTVLILLLGWVVNKFVLARRRKSPLPLPPGPTPLPLIGNALQLPTENQHLKYLEWKDTYGDIIYLNALGTHILILNSKQAVSDLLEKRGKIYSDRPRSIISGLTRLDESMAFQPYGNGLREFHRLSHQSLNSRAIEKYFPIQEEEAITFVLSLLGSPDDLIGHVDRTTSNVTLRVLYGLSPSSELDKFSSLAQKLLGEVSKILTEGPKLLQVFPILRYIPPWFPGASFKRKAAELSELRDYLHGAPFETVKHNIASGINLSSTSLCGTLLQEGADGQPVDSAGEGFIRLFLGSLFPPGQETTASVLSTFFLLMAKHPEVQSKARAEITAVVGNYRLPCMSDRESLPYLDATIKEVLRWESVVPLGVPHQLTEEDEYNGYRLPKGSIIFYNVWAMMHDPLVYRDPLQFLPDRFIGNNDKTSNTPSDFVFGVGRRSCPGLHLAEASLSIYIATVLATCRITYCLDSNGSEIPIEAKFTSGLVVHPQPFRCSVKSLSEDAMNLLRHATERVH